MEENKPVEAILIGAGDRGTGTFGRYAFEYPDKLKYIAVVDPDEAKRQFFGLQHNIPKSRQFKSVKSLIKNLSKIDTRVIINATSDTQHLKTTLPLIKNNFNILLEKPMATTKKSCFRITNEAKENNTNLMICHELRYTEFFTKIKEIIDEGKLGELRIIEHEESVGNLHFAHSYVRGWWNNSKTSGPISLTKTCHDFDLIEWFTKRDKLLNIRSTSTPLFFSEKNVPYKETPKRCTKKCKYFDTCEYAAPTYYLDPNTPNSRKRHISISMDEQEIKKKLPNSQFGRCVYHCDNNVPDYQLTQLDYESGLKVLFLMTAHKQESDRRITIIGSRGKLHGSMKQGEIVLNNYEGKQIIDLNKYAGMHGGGDFNIIEDFLIKSQKSNLKYSKTDIEKSLASHLMAFAAETSRKSGKKIDFQKYVIEIKKENKKQKDLLSRGNL